MTTFHSPDMRCGFCKVTVEKSFHAIDAEARIEFDMGARRIALVKWTETANMQAALAAAGYPAKPA